MTEALRMPSSYVLMDEEEMTYVEDGSGLVTGVVVGILLDTFVYLCAGKSSSQILSEFIKNYHPDMDSLRRTRYYQVFGGR